MLVCTRFGCGSRMPAEIPFWLEAAIGLKARLGDDVALTGKSKGWGLSAPWRLAFRHAARIGIPNHNVTAVLRHHYCRVCASLSWNSHITFVASGLPSFCSLPL